MSKEQRSELEIWLAFYLCKGLGIVSALKILEQVQWTKIPFDNETALSQLGLKQTVATALKQTDWEFIQQLVKRCSIDNIDIIHFYSPHYPKQLKQIHSPPPILFCLGNITLLHSLQLAIVGSRHGTVSGCQIATDIATELVKLNVTVTSGLAMGIDSAAHKGALAVKGNTIAVLGTGINVVYPKRNQALYQQIKQHGLLVSEFLPDAMAKASHFPKRNRIISGLSLGCVVVEAEIKSGSLVSAKYALEQNREVFAVPGSIYNPLSQGCHQLIKQGAKLIENIDDILQELSVIEKNCLYKYIETENKEDFNPLLQHVGYEVTSVDTVASRSGLSMQIVLNQLLDLELSGKVERVLDGYVKLGRS